MAKAQAIVPSRRHEDHAAIERGVHRFYEEQWQALRAHGHIGDVRALLDGIHKAFGKLGGPCAKLCLRRAPADGHIHQAHVRGPGDPGDGSVGVRRIGRNDASDLCTVGAQGG